MKSHEKYLLDLKQWLQDTSDSPLEEMSDFLFARHGRALTGVSPEHAQVVGNV